MADPPAPTAPGRPRRPSISSRWPRPASAPGICASASASATARAATSRRTPSRVPVCCAAAPSRAPGTAWYSYSRTPPTPARWRCGWHRAYAGCCRSYAHDCAACFTESTRVRRPRRTGAQHHHHGRTDEGTAAHDLVDHRRRRLHRRARRPGDDRRRANRRWCYDDLSTGIAERVPDGVPLVVGSTLDAELLARTLADHEVTGVVHLAAKKQVGESVELPLHYYRENIEGLRDPAGRRHGGGGARPSSSPPRRRCTACRTWTWSRRRRRACR